MTKSKTSDAKDTYRDLERLTELLDDKFEIAGFRFGINFIIDLIPGIGDAVVLLTSLYVFVLSFKYKTSGMVKLRMLLNIGLYFLMGLLPVVGDFFAALFKPNRRNLQLLQKHLK